MTDTAQEILPPGTNLPVIAPVKAETKNKRVKAGKGEGHDPLAHVPQAFRDHIWKKGQSGNPGGMSKSVMEVRRLAREASPAVMQRLIETCLTTDDERVLAVTAEHILNRAHGKVGDIVPDDEVIGGRPDVSRLNPKDRDKLKSLLMKAVGKKGGG